MINAKLRRKLIVDYHLMQREVYEDDSKWTAEELAGYFLYNCSPYELRHMEFKHVGGESIARKAAWSLIKKVVYPITYALRA